MYLFKLKVKVKGSDIIYCTVQQYCMNLNIKYNTIY